MKRKNELRGLKNKYYANFLLTKFLEKAFWKTDFRRNLNKFLKHFHVCNFCFHFLETILDLICGQRLAMSSSTTSNEKEIPEREIIALGCKENRNKETRINEVPKKKMMKPGGKQSTIVNAPDSVRKPNTFHFPKQTHGCPVCGAETQTHIERETSRIQLFLAVFLCLLCFPLIFPCAIPFCIDKCYVSYIYYFI